MKKVFINDEYITLSQFLKMEDYISSGGQAKFFLMEEEVYLNNELENRRGKKLYVNDVIRIDEQEYLIANEN